MSVARAELDLTRVRAEIQRLRAQLEAALLREQKLANYVEMARLYEGDEPDVVSQARANSGSMLVSACVEIIRLSGRRQHTRRLVAELAKRGLHVGGVNPVTNLSGALSRSEDLVANRLEGWGLKDWQNGSGPNEGLAEPGNCDDSQQLTLDGRSNQQVSSAYDTFPSDPAVSDEQVPFSQESLPE